MFARIMQITNIKLQIWFENNINNTDNTLQIMSKFYPPANYNFKY